MARVERALVVGAGLAGPAVARGLVSLGIAVDLIEMRPETAELGAGLLLTGNALGALDALGVGDAVRAAGRDVEEVRFADAEDRDLFRLRVGSARGWGSFVSIHRAALRRVLLEGPAPLTPRAGTSIASIDPRPTSVRVRLSTGEEADYDLVIGADGVQSDLRRRVFGAAPVEPIQGYAGWRLVASSVAPISMPTWFLGNGRTLLLHPLRGGELYCGAGPIDETLLGNTGSELDRLRAAFSGFAEPVSSFLAQLSADVRPVPTRYWEITQEPWHRGRCLLIGDAAHACAPTLAQGAAMAFEDAVVLCELLGEERDVGAALAAFTARRRSRIAPVQRASRARMEANRVLAPHALRVREQVLRAVGARRLETQWASLMERPPKIGEDPR